MACYNYDFAAKIELRKGNRDGVMRYLMLAEEGVSDPQDKKSKFRKTLLRNIDQVMRVVKVYEDFE